MQVEIIEVNSLDVLQLQSISIQTFVETFSESNTEENLNKYLETGFTIEKLTNELNNQDSKFYFATFENRIIGYLKLNFAEAQTELKDKNALEIERIYVINEFHGKKVGQLFFQKAIEMALNMQLEYVWLGVWEKNEKAIAFYKKNGFEPFDKHIFMMGDEEQTDIMMKTNLLQ